MGDAIEVYWADMADGAQVVEHATELIVTSFRRVEFTESGHRIQRRDGTTVIGGNAEMGITDEEGPMEGAQQGRRHDSWVAGFGECSIRVCSRLRPTKAAARTGAVVVLLLVLQK